MVVKCEDIMNILKMYVVCDRKWKIVESLKL